MAALEQEILEQVKKLNEAKQRQVLEFARRLILQTERQSELEANQAMTWQQWLALADASRAELRAKYGDHHFNSQALLDELREEASEWPRQ